MENWEKALNKFLERYIHEDWFEGAVLCGSYASGNQDEFSDIDVVIVARNDIGWREKANCVVDGFLMEYTINPISRIEEYMQQGIKQRRLIDQNQFAYGKILYDKNGEIAKLRQLAEEHLAQPLEPLSEYSKAFIKYHLWDKYDELQSLNKKGLHIGLQYWTLVDALISAYYDFHNLAHIPHSKIEKILFIEHFAEKYHIKDLPLEEFKTLLMGCFEAESDKNKMAAVTAFYDYVLTAAGGFDIAEFNGHEDF